MPDKGEDSFIRAGASGRLTPSQGLKGSCFFSLKSPSYTRLMMPFVYSGKGKITGMGNLAEVARGCG